MSEAPRSPSGSSSQGDHLPEIGEVVRRLDPQAGNGTAAERPAAHPASPIPPLADAPRRGAATTPTGSSPATPTGPSASKPRSWPINRRRNRLVWLAGVALLIGVGGVQGLRFDPTPQEVPRAFDAGGITAVQLVAGTGDISVTNSKADVSPAADAAKIGVLTRAGQACEPVQSVTGTTMRIVVSCAYDGAELTLPPGVGVDVEATSADVKLTGTFASAKVTTTSGSVDLGQVDASSGAARVNTKSGDVQGEIAAAATLRVETTSGDTNLDLGDPVKDVDIKATSGSVELDADKNLFNWSVSTTSGNDDDVDRVAGATKPGEVTTTSGDIDIETS